MRIDRKMVQLPSAFIALLLVLVASAAQAVELPDFTELAKDNSPAVVNISIKQSGKRSHKPRLRKMPDLPENSPFKDFFRHFFDERGRPRSRESVSLGSGFIISPDGYILTNHHVVDDADEVIVRLNDRREFQAKVVGSDKQSDVAVIKIDAKDLPVVKLGKSSELKVGEWVLAIGSPFGFDQTVTAGIVSAIGRNLPSENYVPFIQTDVAINPGNSGGPLFNLKGEVIGINSQIYSRSGGFMGLSFAIPIEMATKVASQLRKRGYVSRGYLGVLIQNVDRDLAESFGLDRPRGALVSKVLEDGPAAKAGIKPGDVILSYNGTLLSSSQQLPPLVGVTSVDEEATLVIMRRGKKRTVRMKVGELPVDTKQAKAKVEEEEAEPNRLEELGMTVRDLSAEERARRGAPKGASVIVERVHGGPAAKAEIERGDVVLEVNFKRVRNVAEFRKMIADMPKGKRMAIRVLRGSEPLYLALTVPD